MASPATVELPAATRAILARPSALTVLGRFIRKKPLGAAGGFIMLAIT